MRKSKVSCKGMIIFAIIIIFPSVQHPGGDIVFWQVAQDIINFLYLLICQVAGFIRAVYACKIADHIGEHKSNAFYLGQSMRYVLVAVQVCICNPYKVPEVFLLLLSLLS